MQEWLRPILSESLDNGRDLDQLRAQLEAVMGNYTDVEKAFREGLADPQLEEDPTEE